VSLASAAHNRQGCGLAADRLDPGPVARIK